MFLIRYAMTNDMSTDVLSLEYTGTLFECGKTFDTTQGKRPFIFMTGRGHVIEGWARGVRGMCIGEKRKLQKGSELAYGDHGSVNFMLSTPLVQCLN